MFSIFLIYGVTRGRSHSRRWIDDEINLGRHRLASCSRAHAESSLSSALQIMDFVRKTNLPIFAVIHETAFDGSMLHLIGFSPKRSCIFCLL